MTQPRRIAEAVRLSCPEQSCKLTQESICRLTGGRAASGVRHESSTAQGRVSQPVSGCTGPARFFRFMERLRATSRDGDHGAVVTPRGSGDRGRVSGRPAPTHSRFLSLTTDSGDAAAWTVTRNHYFGWPASPFFGVGKTVAASPDVSRCIKAPSRQLLAREAKPVTIPARIPESVVSEREVFRA